MTQKVGNLPAFPLVYDDPDLFLAGRGSQWADMAYEVADTMLAARAKEEV